jgi:hypothetical protein
VNVWLQRRSLPARGRVGLKVYRCLCIIDSGTVFISTVMGHASPLMGEAAGLGLAIATIFVLSPQSPIAY